MRDSLKVMVLAGGPDRERPVSLMSGGEVAAALRHAGHQVLQRDVLPDQLAALDVFDAWQGDVIFPVLHGAWGEGGALQRLLDQRGFRYVGCAAAAAQRCMDKGRTKLLLREQGLPTPAFELLGPRQRRTLTPPLVIKAPLEGSSIDLYICRDAEQARRARSRLRHRHATLLVEQFIAGKEITVGVLGDDASGGDCRALPPIQIVPATEYYDYDAKYVRDDTQYLFDIDLAPATLARIARLSERTYRVLGCRHLCRVDMMVDAAQRPWILEVNTIPGFTSHSLLPKAAARAGMPMPRLVDHLVRLALREPALARPA